MQPLWPAMSAQEHAAYLARISSSRSPQDAIAAFAGGVLPHTILSTCQGTLLALFDTRTVLPLRSTCKDAVAAVAAHPWDDLETVIHGNVGPALLRAGPGVQKGAWRGCFPRARGANFCGGEMYCNPCGRHTLLVDGDFVHLVGLRRLDMSRCTSVTDAAFAHLAGIQSLDMSFCDQRTITDAAFAHLAGIQSLNMSCCDQATITDAAFAPLAGIKILDMSFCDQPTITDSAFVPLAGIKSLDMSGCRQTTITDAAFAPLAGIQSLVMTCCDQATITEAAFAHLAGIQRLYMCSCRAACISAARAAGLPVQLAAD